MDFDGLRFSMRLRQLAMALSNLPPHPQHDVSLEQYATEGDFAARWVAEIVQRGDLDQETKVVDLGAGNGILGIACHLAGAKSTLLVEKDETCHHDYEGVGWLLGDIKEWNQKDVDLVIMNPPWGTQTSMADRPFLESAFSSDAKVIYLLHSSRATHILPLAESYDWSGEIVLEGAFRLPAKYGHHRSREGTTRVTVWRLTRD
jgi:predicted RNA methylase